MRYITLGDTIDFKFSTRRFSSGAPFTLAGSPVISAYPGNSTTEITAGITLTVDFDARTGLHNVRAVMTSGNGYAANTYYAFVITTGTVDSVSVVGEVVYEVQIGVVPADMLAVSTDTAAADALETMLDGTGGNKLTLEQLRINSTTAGGGIDVDNSAGPAISAVTASSGAAGIEATGSAAGPGITATGGASGIGITATGGGTNQPGARFVGNGTGAGLSIQGGATGAGIATTGGATSGVGFLATGGGGSHGISAVGTGAGVGLNAIGGTTGSGLVATGGGGNTHGASFNKAGTGKDLDADEIAAIQADTDDIQTRLPAALVGGRMDVSVGAVAANAITAASIATDAIDSDAIAASAVTEIQAGLATSAALATVQADTDDIQARLPAALVGGRIDASVGAVAANAITAAAIATGAIDADALATDAVAEIADGVWDEVLSGHLTAGTTGAALAGATAPTAAAVADAVWDEALSGHLTAGSTGAALNAAGGAGDPWITTLPGAYTSGQAGFIVGTNLNATVSSRATQTSVDTVDDFLDTEIAAIKAKTDALPTDPADASDIAAAFVTVNGKLDVIDDFLDTEVAAIKAKTDNLPVDPADASDIAAAFVTVNTKLDTIDDFVDTEIAAIKAKTDLIPAAPAAVGDIPTVAQIADGVWDEAIAGHLTAGSTGAALNTASAGGSAPTAIQIADALLDRDMGAGTDSGSTSVRTPRQALRFLRNKWSIAGTTLTVTKEDDATASWTATLTVTPGADPISASDPAGP